MPDEQLDDHDADELELNQLDLEQLNHQPHDQLEHIHQLVEHEHELNFDEHVDQHVWNQHDHLGYYHHGTDRRDRRRRWSIGRAAGPAATKMSND
jgi:hypothetical protein